MDSEQGSVKVDNPYVYELTKISSPSFTMITQHVDFIHSMLEHFVCANCINDEEGFYDKTTEEQIEIMMGTPCGCEFVLQRYDDYEDYYEQMKLDCYE